MMTARQINFVKATLPAARSAGKAFGMNPVAILSQAAFESGWGTSRLAREDRNYFGLTAYGASNAYWHGAKRTVETARYRLDFRHYDTLENSFLDFARLIRTGYRTAWSLSDNLEAYAKEIAYSPYISERNGDNREVYRKSLVSLAQTIEGIISSLTNVCPPE